MPRKVFFSLIPAVMALVVLVLFSHSFAATKSTESNDEYIFKSIVEGRLEDRLYNTLSEIIGSDRMVIIVNADVKTLSKSRRKPSAAQKARNALVLPGVPIRKEIGRDKDTQADLSNLPPSVVTRIMVTVFVDESVSDQLIDVMRDIAIKAIGYNPDRGDIIDIKKIELKDRGFPWITMLQPPHLYWVILITIGSFFLVTAAIFLMDPFRKLITGLKSANWDKSTTVHEKVLGLDSLGQGGGAGGGGDGTSHEEMRVGETDKPRPFTFVRESHIQDMIFLLRDMPDTDISIVINYLSPELASKLFESFPEEKQAEISLVLSNPKEVPPQKVQELEDTMKMKLDYVMGGDNRLASILNLADDDTRERIIDRIEEKEVAVAQRLKAKIKSFEEVIRGLPPHAIQMLYRQCDPTMFALTIQSTPEDVQKKVLDALSEGATERVQEEMRLSSALSKSRLRKEKNQIMTIIRRMASAGIIEEMEG